MQTQFWSTFAGAAVIGLMTAFTLAGCATPYQSKGLAGGYGDSRIDVDTFRITFTGNGYTDTTTVENYFLFRAAEVAKANGFDWFMVGDDRLSRRGHLETEISGVVKMFKGSKPEGRLNAYDAGAILRNLKPM
ncbi:MAG: hypothetical protein EPO20_15080 [Betaproteobacteria bacterium]|nr:MAG: hypothetical protein EPO20_15080 [Betaproteobacteria bacterium]